MIPIWAFVGVALPLVLMPGASTAVVLRNSLSGGTRAGLETAIGANAGSVCFGVLCAFGFSLVIERWPAVWLGLRAASIAYLTWLGVQSIGRGLTRPGRPFAPAPAQARTRAPRALQNLRDGFITNATNPALATFYFVILPQFIPKGASIVRAALVLTGIHVAMALSWHAAWAAAGGALSRTLASGRARQVLDLITGATLLAFAVTLIL